MSNLSDEEQKENEIKEKLPLSSIVEDGEEELKSNKKLIQIIDTTGKKSEQLDYNSAEYKDKVVNYILFGEKFDQKYEFAQLNAN